MRHTFGTLELIAYPAEAGGAVGAVLPDVERAVSGLGLEYRLHLVSDPREAEGVARDTLARGGTFVVVVGGDRMVNEALNGMFDGGLPIGSQPVLGLVPASSGCDFARNFGLPDEGAAACRYLAGDNSFPVDVGRVTATGPDGSSVTRYFAGLAQVGLGAEAAVRTLRLPHRLRSSRAFLGYWLTMLRFRPVVVHIASDRRTFDGSVHDVMVANGQFRGGGIRVSPRSWPSDGYLDLLVMTGPKSDSFTMLPRMYRGEHLPHPNVREFRIKAIRLEAERPLAVTADGIVVGTTPATFEVVPEAIRVKV